MINSKPRVLFIGVLPPPLHGQSTVNAQILELLEPECDLVKVDISPRRLKRSSAYHLVKIGRVLRGSVVVLQTNPRCWLYLSLDSGWGLSYNALLVAIARLVGLRLLLHHHSYAYIVRPSALMRLLLSAAGRNAHHIFLCDCMRDQFAQAYAFHGQGQLVSDALFAMPAEIGSGRSGAHSPLRVGLLSNLTAEKGLHDFLQLLRVAKQRSLPITGILAGPPVSPADADAIALASRELGPYLDYRGAQFGADRDRFYADIDVFLFPTRYAIESYGQVVVEALGKALPTIAYGRGCISSYLTSPGGYAVPTCDDFVTAALARLERWVEHPRDYAASSAAAVNLSRALYEQAKGDLAGMLALLRREPQ